MLPIIISPRSTSWNCTAQKQRDDNEQDAADKRLGTVCLLSAAAAYTLNVVRAVVSSGFNGNIIVFLEVDTSVAAGEQLTMDK